MSLTAETMRGATSLRPGQRPTDHGVASTGGHPLAVIAIKTVHTAILFVELASILLAGRDRCRRAP